MEKQKKVFVGLSGGVDSSVSAAILKEQGFDVVGVFIKVWQPDFLPCTWREDRLDAMRVAAHLDVPFITIDLEKEYKEEIVDYMVREYKNGRIPNPDVMCNKYIKFGAFLDKALEMGTDCVATGHYARVHVKKDSENSKLNLGEKDVKYSLLAGIDKNKDQSYFLWTLKQKQLQRVLFPIGEYEKSKVRSLARKFGLATAEKKDSQGLCFVGKLDMKEFLKEFIQEKKGDVLNEEGKVVGWHDGVYFYTIGQRHGFTITEKSTDDAPFFVSGKDIEKNILIVSHKKKSGELAQSKTEVILDNVNWIAGESPDLNKKYSARVRYRQTLQPCRIGIDDFGKTKIVFEEPQIANPGQSVVIYDDDNCLGGGIIL